MHTRIHPVHSISAPLLSQVHIPALVYIYLWLLAAPYHHVSHAHIFGARSPTHIDDVISIVTI